MLWGQGTVGRWVLWGDTGSTHSGALLPPTGLWGLGHLHFVGASQLLPHGASFAGESGVTGARTESPLPKAFLTNHKA